MRADKQREVNYKRRQLLKSLVAIPLVSSLSTIPSLSFAAYAASGDKRFILVILRGAMDGLAAVAPYGDPALTGLRGSLLPAENELHKLDSFFGLHPAFSNLFNLYQESELAICHAVASPYRQRSHFDGQNVLEIGLDGPDQAESGWLNRCVPLIGQNNRKNTRASPAMAIGPAVPAVLLGDAEVGSWAPAILPVPSDSTMARLQRLYSEDEFLGAKLEQALLARDMVGENSMNRSRRPGQNFNVMIDATAKFMSQEHGPAIAVMESSGWDTHANQGATQGQLARKFTELDEGLARLKRGLGTSWNNTVVVVVTEFGRTAAVNGTQGTDHGTAGVAFLLGGSVNGGKVLGQWPGLASGNLFQGRDLRPTTDMRSLFKTVLRDHLGTEMNKIDSIVFPASSAAAYLDGLV